MKSLTISGLFYTALVVFLGIIFYFITERVTSRVDLFVMQVYWFLGGALGVLPAVWINRKKLHSETLRVFSFATLIALGTTIGSLLYFVAILLTGSSTYSIINKSKFLFTICFGVILLKEKVSQKTFFAIAFVIVGIVGLSLQKQTNLFFWGILAGIGSACWYALHDVLIKKHLGTRNSAIFLFWRSLMIMLFSLLAVLMFRGIYALIIPSIDVFFTLLAGFLGVYLQKFFMIKAFETTETHVYAIITTLDTVFILLLAPIFSLQQNILSPQQMLWGLVILLGAVMVIWEKLRVAKPVE